MAWNRRKYGNKKPEFNGLKFDSELELFAYKLLTKFKIDFEWQHTVILQPKFRSCSGKAIRSIKCIVDFVIKMPNKLIYIDTKGYPTEVSKIKYKMLEYKLINEGGKYEIVWLKNKREVTDFVIDINEEKKDFKNGK